MSDHKSMVCVGGPRSGQRFAILDGNGFRVPVQIEQGSAADPFSPDYQPNRPVNVEFTDYHAEQFHTPQGDVSFWVPVGQTPLETITLLLEHYEASAKRERR
jgi:hypothetical protein